MTKVRWQRLALVLMLFLICCTIVALLLYALRANVNYYYTPSELPAELLQHTIKLGGIVKLNSLTRYKGLSMQFIVTDNIQELPVKYTGVLPGLFAQGKGVVAVGRLYNQDGKTYLQAHQILAKHDENYAPPLPRVN